MKKEKKWPVYTTDLIGKDLVAIIYSPDIEEHAHCFWEINIITPHSNKIDVINGEKMTTEQGLICFLRPEKDRHYIKSTNETLSNHYDMYISSEQMKKFCGLFSNTLYEELLQAVKTPCFVPQTENFENLVNELNYIKKLQLTMYSTAKMRFSSTAAYLLGLYVSSLEEHLPPPAWFEEMLRKIDNTEDFSAFSLQSLISSVHYSHGHICREFKKFMNMTPVEYINNVKLEKSLRLLMHNLKIIDIANRLGYCSQSAFENAFKKKYGTSPGTWRKKNNFRV